jgi:hypothetical protein
MESGRGYEFLRAASNASSTLDDLLAQAEAQLDVNELETAEPGQNLQASLVRVEPHSLVRIEPHSLVRVESSGPVCLPASEMQLDRTLGNAPPHPGAGESGVAPKRGGSLMMKRKSSYGAPAVQGLRGCGGAPQAGILAWSTDDVRGWLVREGMECVAGAARERRIDGRDLIHFDKECWSELGVSAALDRARLMARLQEASKEAAAAEQAAAPRAAVEVLPADQQAPEVRLWKCSLQLVPRWAASRRGNPNQQNARCVMSLTKCDETNGSTLQNSASNDVRSRCN